MRETGAMLEYTLPWCEGYGVDFGCSDDPHPYARVLVDSEPNVHHLYHGTHEVHVRDINKGFDDWIEQKRSFDFVYSSHLLEHLIDPHAFLRTCNSILKPGGRLVLILPDQDFYWPNGHPHANPDHKWWHLSPEKVDKWVHSAFEGNVYRAFLRPADGPCGGAWGFVAVYEKLTPKPGGGRAILVLGPESSGTRFVTSAFIQAGCHGSADHDQPLDRQLDGHPIVWRRSLPHGGSWPDLRGMIAKLRKSGYAIEGVCCVRDAHAMIQSQLKAGHVMSVEQAERNISEAYRRVYTLDVPIRTITDYNRPEALASLIRSFGLPTDDLPQPRDENAKHYSTG